MVVWIDIFDCSKVLKGKYGIHSERQLHCIPFTLGKSWNCQTVSEISDVASMSKDRYFPLLVALQGESIWKGVGCGFGYS